MGLPMARQAPAALVLGRGEWAVSAPTPGSPEWRRLITASKVATILNLAPWEGETPYLLWHRMRGNLPWGDETRAMLRGSMLEDAVLDWWLVDHPGHTEVSRQPYYPLGDWAGATPDMLVTGPDGAPELVDAKTTGDGYAWATEVPVYYFASSQWQMACAPDVQRVHLAALTGKPRFDLTSHVVERDDEVIAHIVRECRAFYDSLSGDTEPPLSNSPAEYEAIRTVHPDIDPDEVAVLDDELVDRYLGDIAHAERVPATKARILQAMGRARRAKSVAGQTICRRQPKGDAVTLVRVAPIPELDQETQP